MSPVHPRVTTGGSQASYCLSEADAGSDVAAIRCRAVRDGNTYVLSGSKYWITNAGISDTYTVFAKTDPDAGHRGISCFLVEAEWGVTVAKHEDKMGLRGSPTAEILLDDIRVPVDNLVGKRATDLPSPCTHWIAIARSSGPRPSGSPKVPSTVPPRT